MTEGAQCVRHFTAARRRQLQRRLLAWYAKHARDLPWRRTSDPYRVWISEVMLQQTQVATVREYFERFLRELPTVAQLAAAEEEQVLRLWEGLGYYRRARQLHAAAKQVVQMYGGRLPEQVAELRELPGIGRYTAGAIASIAYGRRTPILEANTIRLLSRLVGFRGDVSKREGLQTLWRVSEEILPEEKVATFNQALMELGSLVCIPAEPHCVRCPLAEFCAARQFGLQDSIPAPKPPKNYTPVREAAVLVRKNRSVILRKYGEGERWGGLWDFPRFSINDGASRLRRRELVEQVQSLTGVTCAPASQLTTIKHSVTRFRITLDCYWANFVSGRIKRGKDVETVRWVPLADLRSYPLSATGRRIAKLAVSNTA